MARLGRQIAIVAMIAGYITLTPAPVQAATGPYTLPFFDPGIGITPGRNYTCGSPPVEPCHDGIDYQVALGGAVASARSGLVVDVVTSHPTNGTCDTAPREGNYILIQHSSTRYTLYYHLKNGGSRVSFGEKVAAGQVIGDAGNSGTSCGAHLHYQITTSLNESWKAVFSINPAGTWTTDDGGRVPWLAKFESSSHSGYHNIPRGCTRTHWITVKNKGGRKWFQTNGPAADMGLGNDRRVYLGATDNGGNDLQPSDFAGGDWISWDEVDEADQSTVLPDGFGTFTFGIEAGLPLGDYEEQFNLWAQVPNPPAGPPDDRWFWLRDANGNDIDTLDVLIRVTAPHTC
jgi:Peptidase family M23